MQSNNQPPVLHYQRPKLKIATPMHKAETQVFTDNHNNRSTHQWQLTEKIIIAIGDPKQGNWFEQSIMCKTAQLTSTQIRVVTLGPLGIFF